MVLKMKVNRKEKLGMSIVVISMQNTTIFEPIIYNNVYI